MEIGDKLRRCPDGVCVLDGNIDRTVQKVLDENNFVAVLVKKTDQNTFI